MDYFDLDYIAKAYFKKEDLLPIFSIPKYEEIRQLNQMSIASTNTENTQKKENLDVAEKMMNCMRNEISNLKFANEYSFFATMQKCQENKFREETLHSSTCKTSG